MPPLENKEAFAIFPERSPGAVALDHPLSVLPGIDPRKGRLAQFHFFGELGVEKTIAAMGNSPKSV
jgi:hypothetical protein